MNDLAFYFKIGWQHIISIDAIDHLLFIMALAAIYLIKDWKKLLILVTAFTIGHSFTLALSVYNIIRINDNWVEFLIPCTIIITSIFNFIQANTISKSINLNYFFALFFGLIHGLGFANSIRFILAKDQTIGWGLFGFNVGLEAGQLIVISSILLFSYVVVSIVGVKKQWWIRSLSTITFCISLKMMIEICIQQITKK